MAEFQWWLLIVGIVAGGGLVGVVFMDNARRDADLSDEERRAEANWIAGWIASEGRSTSAEDVHAVLLAHRDYLELPPPDRLAPAEPRSDRAEPSPEPRPEPPLPGPEPQALPDR